MKSLLLQFVGGVALVVSPTASAETLVFNCDLKGFDNAFVITVYGDKSARVGREQGIGNKAQAYYDRVTGAWIAVEFIDGGSLPSSMTTILKDGVTWHSRHTLSISGEIMPSQMSGTCLRRQIH